MSKSVRLTNDTYLDTSSIVHNKQKLNEIIDTKIITGQEVATNEYVDGKQVFVKRFKMGNVVNNGSVSVEHGLGGWDKWRLVKITGSAVSLYNGQAFSIPCKQFLPNINSNKLILSCTTGFDWSNGEQDLIYLNVYYTKTTT